MLHIKTTISSFFSKVEDRMDEGDKLVARLQHDVDDHMAKVINPKKQLESQIFSLGIKLTEIEV